MGKTGTNWNWYKDGYTVTPTTPGAVLVIEFVKNDEHKGELTCVGAVPNTEELQKLAALEAEFSEMHANDIAHVRRGIELASAMLTSS